MRLYDWSIPYTCSLLNDISKVFRYSFQSSSRFGDKCLTALRSSIKKLKNSISLRRILIQDSVANLVT